MLLPSTKRSCIWQYHAAQQLQRTWACTEVKRKAAEGSKHKIKALLNLHGQVHKLQQRLMDPGLYLCTLTMLSPRLCFPARVHPIPSSAQTAPLIPWLQERCRGQLCPALSSPAFLGCFAGRLQAGEHERVLRYPYNTYTSGPGRPQFSCLTLCQLPQQLAAASEVHLRFGLPHGKGSKRSPPHCKGEGALGRVIEEDAGGEHQPEILHFLSASIILPLHPLSG